VKVDVSSIFHVPKNDEKASSLESLPQAALATTPVTRAINKVLALLTLLVLLAFGAPLPSVRAWLGIVDLLKIASLTRAFSGPSVLAGLSSAI